MTTLRSVVVSLRPWQWLKNLAVFPGVIFSQRADRSSDLLLVCAAFAVFCLASSAGYLLNDVLDRKRDRAHPVKQDRPVARGDLSISVAVAVAGLLILASLTLAWLCTDFSQPLSGRFVVFPVIYLAISLSYSIGLKTLLLVDVLVIAVGFLVRVLAGGAAIDVEISSWLLVCTFFLATFLGLAKRRAEYVNAHNGANEHPSRPVLAHYEPDALNILIGATTAALLVSYVLYTVSDRTVEMFGTRNLFFTIPIAFYGVGRYLLLVLKPTYGQDPAMILYRDRPLQITAVLWLLTVILILY